MNFEDSTQGHSDHERDADREREFQLELRIQRLVDNELADADLPELLNDLELQDGAWRRCALTFIESREYERAWGELGMPQSGSQSLESTLSERASSQRTVGMSSSGETGDRDSSRGHWSQMGMLAASLLLAFVLGFQTRSLNKPAPSSPQQDVATAPIRPGVSSEMVSEKVSDTDKAAMLVGGTDPGPSGRQFQLDDQRELGQVRLRFAADDGPQAVSLPVYASSAKRHHDLIHNSAIPAELVQRLRAAGIQVERRVQMKPINVEDVGVITVPVEEVQFLNQMPVIP